MNIVNNVSISSVYVKDKDHQEVKNTYHLGQVVQVQKPDHTFEGTIDQIVNSNIILRCGEELKTVRFSEIEPCIVNPPGASLHENYYATRNNDNYVLVQGHQTAEPGDEIYITIASKGIIQVPVMIDSIENSYSTDNPYIKIVFRNLQRPVGDNRIIFKRKECLFAGDSRGILIYHDIYFTKINTYRRDLY